MLKLGCYRNKCPKLYGKTFQVGQFAHVAHVSEGQALWPMYQGDMFSQVPKVFISDGEFKNTRCSNGLANQLYILLFWHIQVTLLRVSLFRSPNTWIINTFHLIT